MLSFSFPFHSLAMSLALVCGRFIRPRRSVFCFRPHRLHSAARLSSADLTNKLSHGGEGPLAVGTDEQDGLELNFWDKLAKFAKAKD